MRSTNINTVPSRGLILLEDIDGLIVSYAGSGELDQLVKCYNGFDWSEIWTAITW